MKATIWSYNKSATPKRTQVASAAEAMAVAIDIAGDRRPVDPISFAHRSRCHNLMIMKLDAQGRLFWLRLTHDGKFNWVRKAIDRYRYRWAAPRNPTFTGRRGKQWEVTLDGSAPQDFRNIY
tara:strand:+ start:4238 stop:4603 length:366 start_codon:yes stop_codon:yes gene_type:complete